MLKLRSIGLSDYSVLEGRQRIGRIRLATERIPCVWLWSVTVHLPGGLPMGSAKDLDTAKAEFKAAWEALKARTTPERARGGLQGNEHSGRLTVDRLSFCAGGSCMTQHITETVVPNPSPALRFRARLR